MTLSMRGQVSATSPRKPEGKLASGTRWETPYFVVEGEKAGPTVMLIAGMHGDEPAPPRAADTFLDLVLKRGRLVVVPRASQPALSLGKRLTADAENPNLNRNFPVGDHVQPRGRMAEELWSLVRKIEPQWLVDLHEGSGFHRAGDKSVGSSVIRSDDEEVHKVAKAIVNRVNATITHDGHEFDLLGPPVEGSIARAVRRKLGIRSMILETSVPQPMERRIHQHQLMVRTLLEELDMIDPSLESDEQLAQEG